ncbi:conserved hypothetical protein [Talaromyces stipitatus ATCC 10500]|uniref:Uncharacterized protein n=1 Tax=Talaromyces stipitatus (strain ATCC 10500 / CBS 375.48 / QM 6759 / NRRL 1006) TaxID=441959 RepID=B8MRW9_TALSN|nr:uncharacterized protein TSTA_057920 [Talaromyces stipitatus ATCC 10500]EED13303.1 conserved hypothetical protein [Talaromyces stipitatus ATCC 10500]
MQIYGLIPNPEMAKVIPGRTTAQIPDMNGTMPAEPSKESIVVLLLGFKSNRPLRMLSSGFKETSDHFMAMLQSFDSPEGREEFGFLGGSSYLGSSGQASNEIVTISYWRGIEGLHAFAESPIHRQGWDWWNRTVKEHPHLFIFHEIYKAEGKSHDNIYFNAQPTLIGGTAFPVKSNDKVERQWVNPLVDANRGILATSRGRLGLRGHD